MEKDVSKAKVLVCDDSMMVRNKMKKLLTHTASHRFTKPMTVLRQLKSLRTLFPISHLWIS